MNMFGNIYCDLSLRVVLKIGINEVSPVLVVVHIVHFCRGRWHHW